MFRKRDTIEEKFTTILNLGWWQADLRLKANLLYLNNLYPKQDEIFWFNYFWEQVRERNCPLAQKHLLSYLEETSDLCASRVQGKLKNTIYRDVVDHFFQEARLIILHTIEFWHTYDPSRSKPLIYAYRKLESSLLERFTNHRSDYGLLLSVSSKRLEEDLKEYGFRGTQLSQHLIVAIELRKIGTDLPRNRKAIQEPTPVQLEKIGQYCQELYKEVFSPHQIRNILQNCIKALKFSQPWVTFPPPEILDIIVSSGNDDEVLESPEYSRIFLPVIEKLITNPESNTLLILGYGFVGINQELIGTVFSPTISQYTISRKTEKIRNNLQWQLTQEFLDKLPDHPQLDINILNDRFMKSIIIWYYRQEVFHEELEEWIRSHPESLSIITFLAGYFSYLPQEDAQKLLNYELTKSQLNQQIKATKKKLAQNLQEAALKLRITEQELLKKVNSSTSEGVTYLSSWLGRRCSLSKDFLREIQDHLDQTIYIFFANAPYADLAIGSPIRPNVLTQDIFAKLWKTEEEIPAAFPHLPVTVNRVSSDWASWARKIDIKLEITNYSFTLLIGFKKEEKYKYFVQIRIYPTNGQKYLPENLGLLMLETNGNVFERAKSREADNWIQVEFKGRLKEEFQIKIQLEEVSIIENFVI